MVVNRLLIGMYNHRLWHSYLSLLNDRARDSSNDAPAIYALRTLNFTLGKVPLLLLLQRSAASL
jgi:hypothetical protein